MGLAGEHGSTTDLTDAPIQRPVRSISSRSSLSFAVSSDSGICSSESSASSIPEQLEAQVKAIPGLPTILKEDRSPYGFYNMTNLCDDTPATSCDDVSRVTMNARIERQVQATAFRPPVPDVEFCLHIYEYCTYDVSIELFHNTRFGSFRAKRDNPTRPTPAPEETDSRQQVESPVKAQPLPEAAVDGGKEPPHVMSPLVRSDLAVDDPNNVTIPLEVLEDLLTFKQKRLLARMGFVQLTLTGEKKAVLQ